jgi:hypothetical protein
MTPPSFNLPLSLRFARQANPNPNPTPEIDFRPSCRCRFAKKKKQFPAKKQTKLCKSPPNRCATKQAWMHLPPLPCPPGFGSRDPRLIPLWKKARKSYKSFLATTLHMPSRRSNCSVPWLWNPSSMLFEVYVEGDGCGVGGFLFPFRSG